MYSLKVRLQTRGPGAPSTMLGTFVHILRNNGVFGLYNGVRTLYRLHEGLPLTNISFRQLFYDR